MVNHLPWCVIFGAVIIVFWYLNRGKSVKAINDFVLFLNGASVSYNLLITSVDSKINSETSTIFIVLIAMCSIAKAIIILFEFVKERIEETITLNS